MELQLKLTGILLIALALFHAPFPVRFKWKTELSSLSVLNRQIMYVHTFFIALTLLLMGVLCFTCAHEIVSTVLGKWLALGLFIFWFMRLVMQFFGFSSQLWRGKRFETVVHMLFSLLWAYFSVVFFVVYWGNNSA